jgi:hypothetical protein
MRRTAASFVCGNCCRRRLCRSYRIRCEAGELRSYGSVERTVHDRFMQVADERAAGWLQVWLLMHTQRKEDHDAG